MNRLREILGILGEAYLVGGAVRDSLIGQAHQKDYDIEVFNVSYEELLKRVSALGACKTVGKSFGVVKLSHPILGEIDISIPRTERKTGQYHQDFDIKLKPHMTIKEAAKRRDFTMNAIYFNFEKGYVDPYSGSYDLEMKILREVNMQTFAEDPLRVLRGMQFAARFGLVPSDSLIALSAQLYLQYEYIPTERIWEEWKKWALRSTVPSKGLSFLSRTLWIGHYPQLNQLTKTPQDPEHHPEGNVFKHTMHVCDAAQKIAVSEQLEEKDRLVLMFAALCHDMGKSSTTFVDKYGRIVSPNHAAKILPTLTFLASIGAPIWLKEQIIPLVHNHMAHLNNDIGRSGVRRLASKMQPSNIRMLGMLVEADHSGRPPLEGGVPENMQRIIDMAENLSVTEATVTPLVNGYDLISLGMTQGVALGNMLRRIYELQMDGKIETREQALEWTRRQLD